MEEVERGRVVRVEMEDVASGLEWTQIGVYMPVRGQAKVTIAASKGTQDPQTKDPAQDAWESLSDELEKKLNILSFALASETRDRTHPYTGEMGLRLAPACPVCTG